MSRRLKRAGENESLSFSPAGFAHRLVSRVFAFARSATYESLLAGYPTIHRIIDRPAFIEAFYSKIPWICRLPCDRIHVHHATGSYKFEFVRAVL